MDQSFLNFLYAGGMSLLGWLGKTLWDANQRMREDFTRLEINLPKDYVSKEDYKEDIADIKSMLKELYEIYRNHKA